MRVLALPADDGGCGHYRMIWPAEALAAQGAEITVAGLHDDSGIDGIFADMGDGPELIGMHKAPEADVVVLQRPLLAERLTLIRLLQEAGIRVVIEIDDDFGALHPRNVSFASCHPARSPRRNWRILAQACAMADYVVVTTPALAIRYGQRQRVAVVPNHVPARYLAERRTDHDGVVVGWTGSLDTHPTDLQVTRGAVQRALGATGATFGAVGTGRGVQDALGLAAEPAATGWLPIDEYPAAMAQHDVGLVPLDDIRFNDGKSWLKGLEYAALGVPFVASPVADYVRLHARGAGLLAAKPKDWLRQVRRLATGADERAEVAAAGRAVAADLTIEGNADRWWDAWTACLHMARRAAA
ncbi:MAG: glycosyltransferase family protein [Acidimicrobiales bacterium]